MKKIDLVGQKFGRLTVVKEEGVKNKRPSWLCECECGNFTTVAGTHLRQGSITSCGCYRLDMLIESISTHGKSNTREYTIWCLMKGRCNNTKSSNYKHYGGRGIKVCDRWADFDNFLSDMGEAPPNYSIERINNDLGYSPENCTWADQFTQTANQRIKSNNTTGTTGVYKDKGRWIALITRNKKTHYLGAFNEIENAIAARKAAEQIFDSRSLSDTSNEAKPSAC